MRHCWLFGVALLLVGSVLSGRAEAAQSDFRLTLIGSGNPVPEADRFGPATLVEAGDQKLLFDAGRGATIRLWQLKIPFSKILTHHNADYGKWRLVEFAEGPLSAVTADTHRFPSLVRSAPKAGINPHRPEIRKC